MLGQPVKVNVLDRHAKKCKTCNLGYKLSLCYKRTNDRMELH